MLLPRCRPWRVGEFHELRDIVWPASFQSRAEGGFAVAAKGLSQDNRPNGGLVNVKIPGVDGALPQFDLSRIESLESAGETVAGGIDKGDRIFQSLVTHHSQQWSEEFREMSNAARLHTVLNAG